jgi:hypothetical protein
MVPKKRRTLWRFLSAFYDLPDTLSSDWCSLCPLAGRDSGSILWEYMLIKEYKMRYILNSALLDER